MAVYHRCDAMQACRSLGATYCRTVEQLLTHSASLRCAALCCAAACGPFESMLNRTAVEPSLWEDKTLQGRPIGGGSGNVSTTWEDNYTARAAEIDVIIFAVSIHSFDAVVRDFPTAALSNILVVDVLSVKVRLTASPPHIAPHRIAPVRLRSMRRAKQAAQRRAGWPSAPAVRRYVCARQTYWTAGRACEELRTNGPVDSLRRVVCGCLLGPSETDPVASAWADGGHRVHSPDVRPGVGTVREHCRCL